MTLRLMRSIFFYIYRKKWTMGVENTAAVYIGGRTNALLIPLPCPP